MAHPNRTSASETSPTASEDSRIATKRVTFVIPQELDDLLEVYCNWTGNLKNGVAAEALADYLVQKRDGLRKAVDSAQLAIDRLPSYARSSSPASV